MQWSDISFDPPRRTLRQFAGLWLVFFGGLALWQWFGKGHGAAAVALAGLAVTLGPIGLVWPRALRWVYVTWMVLVFPIGWTVSRVILGLIYFGMFTPISLFFRLVGRDALHRRRPEGVDTYWVTKPQAATVDGYLRPF